VKAGAQLVTSNLVLAEVHAFLLSRLGHTEARQFLRTVMDGDAGELVWVDAALTVAASEGWINRRPDKAFSLADATSFEIMLQRDISHAFTFDHDFVRAGFKQLK
jgi:predicted nucleic acid-binding protein